MGLDVVAYSKIDKVYNIKEDEETGEFVNSKTGKVEDYDNYFVPYLHDHYPLHGAGLEHGAFYEFEEREHMWAGSYSGYYLFRNELARIAGYSQREFKNYDGETESSYCVLCWNGMEGPFSELINFSDCEGVIGSRYAKKLYDDFLRFKSKAESEMDSCYFRKYKEWINICRIASDGGAIEFR